MDDMTAFERRLADGFKGLMGPSEPVDAAAIFTAITATQSPKWRLQPMFSAVKFVVAAAIVALFGGFLLAGVVTQPRGDDVTPAAVSPSPMSTEGLLSGMVTEEVEPGVLRVLDDGAGHDLAAMHLGGVWAGGDGSMWVLEEPFDGAGYGYRLLRLGRPGDTPIDIGNTYWFDMAIDPDGTVWAKTGADYQFGALATNDGATMPWRTREYQTDHAEVRAVEAGPDGTVWVTREVSNAAGPWVARHDGSSWMILPPSDDPELQGDYHGEGPYVDVGPDGTVWVANGNLHTKDTPGPQGILRFDGTAWVLESPVPERADLHAGPLTVGPDGTAWVYLASREPVPPGLRLLVRWSDGEWTTHGSVIDLLGGQAWEARLAVDDAGTLWIAFENGGPYLSFAQRAVGLQQPTPDEGPCTGVLSFDGTSWRQYLRGRCVNHVAVAPDGSIWASAATHPDSTDLDIDDIDGLYVITPEAAAATK